MNPKFEPVLNEIRRVIKGKDEVILRVLQAILAKGHILLEDIPGVGKTTLALSVSRTLSMEYHRMQFTPDVLPSDLLGFNLLNAATREFEFRPGAVFCNLFLADEINRTSPKTQSALLEVMEEGSVTVDGVTRILDEPFIVIATQNPLGSSGTQKLPESQLDRFMVRLSMGYPDHADAVTILKGDSHGTIRTLNAILSQADVLSMQKETEAMFIHETLYDYIVRLTEATRNPNYFITGLSPRASLSLLKMSKADAYVSGSKYVLPDHVLEVFHDVAIHRLALSSPAKARGLSVKDALKEIADSVALPKA